MYMLYVLTSCSGPIHKTMSFIGFQTNKICVKTPRYLSYVDYYRRYSQFGDFMERAYGRPFEMYIL